MKTHYSIEKYVPDYEERNIFGGPALKREFVNLCGSRVNYSTRNIDSVTCRACIKKMTFKPKWFKEVKK